MKLEDFIKQIKRIDGVHSVKSHPVSYIEVVVEKRPAWDSDDKLYELYGELLSGNQDENYDLRVIWIYDDRTASEGNKTK